MLYKILLIYIYIYTYICIYMCKCVCCVFIGLDNKFHTDVYLHEIQSL